MFKLVGYGGITTQCIGKWYYDNIKVIKIICNDEDFSAQIEQGYMSQRERRIKILKDSRLKMPVFLNANREYVVLRKTDTMNAE